MAGLIKAIRGMHDTLPDTFNHWQLIKKTVREILKSYGYLEIHLPILEKTELFERSIGETTDIVSKEMYTFSDRNGESITLRPEGTAGCVRAILENGLYQNSAQKLWYSGPMFRYERPQKGRLRQFHQIGVEACGMPGPDIDAELIIMCSRIWKKFQLNDLRLEINSLGNSQARKNYRNQLVQYFNDHKDQLDEDSLKRLQKNPLRILDSKNTNMQSLIKKAPSMTESLDQDSREHFNALQHILNTVNINYTINPRLVRGLDYYNRTVFEWVTDQLGAQGTICAGGRYDGMVEHFGGPPIPAIGFAMGIERLISLIETNKTSKTTDTKIDIYFVIASEQAKSIAFSLAEKLRDDLPQLQILMHFGGGSFKSQFKKADKSGAKIALIMGENELEQQRIGVKSLRGNDLQMDVVWSEITDTVRKHLNI